MASPQMAQAKEMEAAHFAEASASPTDSEIEILRRAMPALAMPLPDHLRVISASIQDSTCYWMIPESADLSQRIVYVHGGGFVTGSYDSHHLLAGWLAEEAKAALLFIDYQRAPETRFPKQLEEIERAMRWVRINSPDGISSASKVIIAGDSAGAGMSLACMVRLRDTGQDMPTGAVLLCGMFDVDEGTSRFIQAAARRRVMVQAYLGPDGVPSDPRASPIRADLSGLPPLLIQTGSEDGCRDESEAVAERARAAGVHVEFQDFDGAFHAWQRFAPLVPEARDALNRVAQFIHALPQ